MFLESDFVYIEEKHAGSVGLPTEDCSSCSVYVLDTTCNESNILSVSDGQYSILWNSGYNI